MRRPVVALLCAAGLAVVVYAAGTHIAGRSTGDLKASFPQYRGSTDGPHVTLAAVGDVLFARGVAKRISERGPDYPFSAASEFIRSADIAFFNLECTLSEGGVGQRRRYEFRASPSLAGSAARAGFDVACLANNHTLDFGRDALLDTVRVVTDAGMTPVGAGETREDALRVRAVERNGLRVGFIAYSDIPTCGVVRLDDRPTIAGVNTDEIPAQVKAAKSACDVLVVSFHWGIEYMRTPTERQRALARKCVEGGADLILGHHPHVPQPVETYRGKAIVYSMGAFVWDSKVFGADRSAIYLFELGKSSARLTRTIPVRITACRPSPMGSE